MTSNLPEVTDRVARFSGLQLSPVERQAFANAALVAKYGDEPAPFDGSRLLAAHRSEDQASNAWTTLNVIQENLIRGGVRYTDRDKNGFTRRRATRATNSVDGNVNINRALWALASELERLKSA